MASTIRIEPFPTVLNQTIEGFYQSTQKRLENKMAPALLTNEFEIMHDEYHQIIQTAQVSEIQSKLLINITKKLMEQLYQCVTFDDLSRIIIRMHQINEILKG